MAHWTTLALIRYILILAYYALGFYSMQFLFQAKNFVAGQFNGGKKHLSRAEEHRGILLETLEEITKHQEKLTRHNRHSTTLYFTILLEPLIKKLKISSKSLENPTQFQICIYAIKNYKRFCICALYKIILLILQGKGKKNQCSFSFLLHPVFFVCQHNFQHVP